MIEAITFNIQFSSVTDASVELDTNEWHDVSLYAADQYFDSVSRKEEIEQNKFELSIRPTETSAGTIATASAADASGVYSVCFTEVPVKAGSSGNSSVCPMWRAANVHPCRSRHRLP